MSFGSLRQTKGLGLWLCCSTKSLMAVRRATTELKTPRWSFLRLSFAKKPSTALSQDADVEGEMKAPARVASEPSFDFGGLCTAPDVGLLPTPASQSGIEVS